MEYTPEIVKELIGHIEANSHVATACRAVGLKRTTFYRWLKDKSKSDISYTIVQKAKAKALLRNVVTIQKASEKSWTAAAWLLERRDPENWAKQDKLEIKSKKTVLTKQVIEFRKEEKKLTEEERKQLVAFTMKAIEEYAGSNGND